jgi:cysteine desulfurase/selenocysteine lyase
MNATTFSTQFRKHFPLFEEKMNDKPLIYLDSAATAAKPQVLAQRLTQFYLKESSNVHRGVYRLSEENTAHYEAVRDQLKILLNAQAREEIIFTKGTTEGLNLLATTLGKSLKSGDEILLSELEHHANFVPWQQLCFEKNLQLKIIPLTQEGHWDFTALDKLLSERTKILTVSITSNTLGTLTNYRELFRLAKSKGVTIIADAAQYVSHHQLDVQTLGADFCVFSAHKLYGPHGVGILWGRQHLLDALPPFLFGGNMISEVRAEKTTFNKLPEKFEAGTPAIAEVIAFGAVLRFLQTEEYWQKIASWEKHMNTLVLSTLSDLDFLHLYGPKESSQRSPIFAFNLKNVHAHDVGQVLDQCGVAVRTGHHCTQPLMQKYQVPSMVRASFAPYNTQEDLEQLVLGLKKAKTLLC